MSPAMLPFLVFAGFQIQDLRRRIRLLQHGVLKAFHVAADTEISNASLIESKIVGTRKAAVIRHDETRHRYDMLNDKTVTQLFRKHLISIYLEVYLCKNI